MKFDFIILINAMEIIIGIRLNYIFMWHHNYINVANYDVKKEWTEEQHNKKAHSM